MSSQTASSREFIAAWDEHAIATERAAIIREDDPSLSDEAAFEEALIDTDFFAMEWDWMLEDLDEALEALCPDRHYHVEGRNLGWRRRSGWTACRADSAADFLAAILPSTPCTFTIEREGAALLITNYHHDAPTGEFYIVTAAATAARDGAA